MTRHEHDKIREAAREAIEDLPAETAGGNIDADSAGPHAAAFSTGDDASANGDDGEHAGAGR